MRDYNCLGKLLTVSLIATVMLDLDVKVERAFTTVHFLTVLVRADVLSIDLFCSAAIVLLAMRLGWRLVDRANLFH